LIDEIYQIVRSEQMAAADRVAETSTNYILHPLPVSLPQRKKMKERQECETLE